MRKSEKISIIGTLAGAAGYGAGQLLRKQGVKIPSVLLSTGFGLASGIVANRVILDDVPENKDEYYDRIARKNQG